MLIGKQYFTRKETFLNHARNLVQLNSEHIVRLFGICVNEGDKHLFVQEFMDLGNLHQVNRKIVCHLMAI